MDLSEHMKETANIIAGYVTGRVVIEHGAVSLQLSSGELVALSQVHRFEVRSGSEYETVTLEQALSLKTAEGWPLLAGLYARVKIEEGTRT